MINPRTGKELHKNKRIVFMYKLTQQDADGVRNALLEEYFRYEEIASLVFSSDPNKTWDFIYYIDDNLANATITWKNEYDKDALDDKCIEVAEAKDIFLKRIDQLICEPEKYKSTMDRIVVTEKNCLLYEYI